MERQRFVRRPMSPSTTLQIVLVSATPDALLTTTHEKKNPRTSRNRRAELQRIPGEGAMSPGQSSAILRVCGWGQARPDDNTTLHRRSCSRHSRILLSALYPYPAPSQNEHSSPTVRVFPALHNPTLSMLSTLCSDSCPSPEEHHSHRSNNVRAPSGHPKSLRTPATPQPRRRREGD